MLNTGRSHSDRQSVIEALASMRLRCCCCHPIMLFPGHGFAAFVSKVERNHSIFVGPVVSGGFGEAIVCTPLTSNHHVNGSCVL
jgi:hypothetical protein